MPYALPLVELIPPVDIRINRDIELLLNAVEAHAILHQASRERDEGATSSPRSTITRPCAASSAML